MTAAEPTTQDLLLHATSCWQQPCMLLHRAPHQRTPPILQRSVLCCLHLHSLVKGRRHLSAWEACLLGLLGLWVRIPWVADGQLADLGKGCKWGRNMVG